MNISKIKILEALPRDLFLVEISFDDSPSQRMIAFGPGRDDWGDLKVSA